MKTAKKNYNCETKDNFHKTLKYHLCPKSSTCCIKAVGKDPQQWCSLFYFPALCLSKPLLSITCHTSTPAKIDNLSGKNIPKNFYKVPCQRDLAIARDLPHFQRLDRALSHPSSAASFPCDLTLVTHSSAQDGTTSSHTR